MNQKKIRVLQVIADFKKGGIQADVMYPTRILPEDDVHTDVMLLSNVVGFYEEEFSQKGAIFRIPLHRKKTKVGRALSIVTHYFQVQREMTKFFREHEPYDAIHARHLLLNAPCIVAAKKAGIPVRIAHCHMNKPSRKEYQERIHVRIYLWLCAKILNRYTTHRFGVTEYAVEYMFGKGNGVVIKNPTVDLQKFDPKKYSERNDGAVHLILVGSYSTRKNQMFALRTFQELLKYRPDSTMTFIGYPRTPDDDYLPKLKRYAAEQGMGNNAYFLPQDTNVAQALAESTFMLITSRHEGLPNVALEAQAMGVPCFVSTDVSRNCDCGICEFLPLDDGPAAWARAIVDYAETNGTGKRYVDMSSWDNRKVCREHLEYWRGKPMELGGIQ